MHYWSINWEIYNKKTKSVRDKGGRLIFAPTAEDAITLFKVNFNHGHMLGDRLDIKELKYIGDDDPEDEPDE